MSLGERNWGGGIARKAMRMREKDEQERLLCKKKLETNRLVVSSHKGCFWRKESSKAGIGKPDERASERAAGKQTTQKKASKKGGCQYTEAKQQEKGRKR